MAGREKIGLDFADKNSVNVINSWVKEKTGGKIDKIVDIQNNEADK
jgi:serine protease inhibitor